MGRLVSRTVTVLLVYQPHVKRHLVRVVGGDQHLCLFFRLGQRFPVYVCLLYTSGFDIHNCVYCDLEDVRTFTKADGSDVRKFETEHVLDKGVCPLVALSLYNFVPSCGTCNGPGIKGMKTIGDTEGEIAKLSPSAEGYDFDGKVKFEVKVVTPGATDLNTTTHADDYEIDFNIIENIYQKSIDLFELKQRYNNKREKMELLKWRDKRRSNPNNIVCLLYTSTVLASDGGHRAWRRLLHLHGLRQNASGSDSVW